MLEKDFKLHNSLASIPCYLYGHSRKYSETIIIVHVLFLSYSDHRIQDDEGHVGAGTVYTLRCRKRMSFGVTGKRLCSSLVNTLLYK